MMVKYVVVIIDDTSTYVRVISQNSKENACKLLEKLYYDHLFSMCSYDFNNTYIEDDHTYGQIVYGLETTKYFVSKVRLAEKNQ